MLLAEDGDIFECNAAAVKILKCKAKADLMGTTPWALSPPLQPASGLPAVHIFQTLQELLRLPPVDGLQPRKRFEWVFKDTENGAVHVSGPPSCRRIPLPSPFLGSTCEGRALPVTVSQSLCRLPWEWGCAWEGEERVFQNAGNRAVHVNAAHSLLSRRLHTLCFPGLPA